MITPPLLSGVWLVVKAELGGQPMPADAAAKVELEFTDDHYEVRFGGEATDQGRFLLAATTDHWQITLTGTRGINAGRSIPGILQVQGDRLRVCYALEGSRPPNAFQAPEGTLHYLATYRRKPALNPDAN